MTQFDEIELNYKVDVNLNSVNETGKFKYIGRYIFSNSTYFNLKFVQNFEELFLCMENMVRGSILLLQQRGPELLSTLTTLHTTVITLLSL